MTGEAPEAPDTAGSDAGTDGGTEVGAAVGAAVDPAIDPTLDGAAENGNPRITLRHRAEYIAARLFAAAVRLVGLRGGTFLARRGGDLIHLVDGRHRRIARENLRRHLTGPGGAPLPEREVRRIARESFRHLVVNAVEVLVLERELARRGFEGIVDVEGLHHLTGALARGTGVILVTGHVGNWELAGAACRHIGVEGTSVYRPLDNPLLDRWVRELRAHLGQEVVPKYGAVRHLLRALKRGRMVCILIDQDARGHGVFAPFMGEPASTIPTPAELALRTGADIITGFALRTGPGFRFREWFEPPVEMPSTGDRSTDVRRITEELNRRLERAVRQAPEQWLWAHRRWKTRPPPEEAIP